MSQGWVWEKYDFQSTKLQSKLREYMDAKAEENYKDRLSF